MKILVTGASGRIGRMLVQALLEREHEVNCLVLPQDPAVAKLSSLAKDGRSMHLIRGGLEHYAEVEPAVAGVGAVYHLGAAMGAFTDYQFFESNARGTFNVLQAVRRVAPNVRRLVFPSSDAVYEKYVPGGYRTPIHPDMTPRDGKGIYALTKIMGEEMCWGFQRTYGIPCAVVRFPIARAAEELPDFYEFWLDGLLGYKRGQVRSDPEAAQAVEQLEALQQATGGERRLIVARDEFGHPYQRVYVDVRDVVQALLLVLEKDAAVGHAFPVAGKSQPATSEQIIPYLSKALDVPYVEASLPGIPTHYAHDDSKTRVLLGYDPQYDVFSMIDDAVARRAQGA